MPVGHAELEAELERRGMRFLLRELTGQNFVIGNTPNFGGPTDNDAAELVDKYVEAMATSGDAANDSINALGVLVPPALGPLVNVHVTAAIGIGPQNNPIDPNSFAARARGEARMAFACSRMGAPNALRELRRPNVWDQATIAVGAGLRGNNGFLDVLGQQTQVGWGGYLHTTWFNGGGGNHQAFRGSLRTAMAMSELRQERNGFADPEVVTPFIGDAGSCTSLNNEFKNITANPYAAHQNRIDAVLNAVAEAKVGANDRADALDRELKTAGGNFYHNLGGGSDAMERRGEANAALIARKLSAFGLGDIGKLLRTVAPAPAAAAAAAAAPLPYLVTHFSNAAAHNIPADLEQKIKVLIKDLSTVETVTRAQEKLKTFVRGLGLDDAEAKAASEQVIPLAVDMPTLRAQAIFALVIQELRDQGLNDLAEQCLRDPLTTRAMIARFTAHPLDTNAIHRWVNTFRDEIAKATGATPLLLTTALQGVAGGAAGDALGIATRSRQLFSNTPLPPALPATQDYQKLSRYAQLLANLKARGPAGTAIANLFNGNAQIRTELLTHYNTNAFDDGAVTTLLNAIATAADGADNGVTNVRAAIAGKLGIGNGAANNLIANGNNARDSRGLCRVALWFKPNRQDIDTLLTSNIDAIKATVGVDGDFTKDSLEVLSRKLISSDSSIGDVLEVFEKIGRPITEIQAKEIYARTQFNSIIATLQSKKYFGFVRELKNHETHILGKLKELSATQIKSHREKLGAEGTVTAQTWSVFKELLPAAAIEATETKVRNEKQQKITSSVKFANPLEERWFNAIGARLTDAQIRARNQIDLTAVGYDTLAKIQFGIPRTHNSGLDDFFPGSAAEKLCDRQSVPTPKALEVFADEIEAASRAAIALGGSGVLSDAEKATAILDAIQGQATKQLSYNSARLVNVRRWLLTMADRVTIDTAGGATNIGNKVIALADLQQIEDHLANTPDLDLPTFKAWIATNIGGWAPELDERQFNLMHTEAQLTRGVPNTHDQIRAELSGELDGIRAGIVEYQEIKEGDTLAKAIAKAVRVSTSERPYSYSIPADVASDPQKIKKNKQLVERLIKRKHKEISDLKLFRQHLENYKQLFPTVEDAEEERIYNNNLRARHADEAHEIGILRARVNSMLAHLLAIEKNSNKELGAAQYILETYAKRETEEEQKLAAWEAKSPGKRAFLFAPDTMAVVSSHVDCEREVKNSGAYNPVVPPGALGARVAPGALVAVVPEAKKEFKELKASEQIVKRIYAPDATPGAPLQGAAVISGDGSQVSIRRCEKEEFRPHVVKSAMEAPLKYFEDKQRASDPADPNTKYVVLICDKDAKNGREAFLRCLIEGVPLSQIVCTGGFKYPKPAQLKVLQQEADIVRRSKAQPTVDTEAGEELQEKRAEIVRRFGG